MKIQMCLFTSVLYFSVMFRGFLKKKKMCSQAKEFNKVLNRTDPLHFLVFHVEKNDHQ